MSKLPDSPITVVLGQRGSGKTSWVKNHIPALPRFILWNTVNDDFRGFDSVESNRDLYEYVWSKRNGVFQVVVNCLEENEANSFDFACKLALALENVCLVIEEVDTFATPTVIPFDLKRVLKVGRHYGVSMVAVSRRPAEINRLITSQAQRFVCFKTIEPNDVRYLTSIIGESARELPEIPPLHYLDWRHGQVGRGKITF